MVQFGDASVYDSAAQMLAAQSYQQPVDSPFLNAMTHIPGAATTMGWNAGRISSTILNGGFGAPQKAIRSHLPRPRNFRRLASAAQVHGANGLYTPANFLADSANKFLPWAFGEGGKATKSGSISTNLTKNGIGLEKGDAPFQSGALGKFNAMYRVGRASKLTEKRAANISSYIRANDSMLAKFIGPEGISAGGRSQARAAADLISMTGNHTATNFLGGMRSAVHGGNGNIGRAVSGMIDGRIGALRASGVPTAAESSVISSLEKSAAGKKAWVRGFEKAESWLKLGGDDMLRFAEKGGLRNLTRGIGYALESPGGKSAAFKVAGAAGMKYATGAIPVVGQVLMAAQLAYDLTNLGISAVEGVGKAARDSVVSMRGSIDKPAFGMGYRDNQVAATSRARGVQAIQNSRLNARSVLGSEAAFMHAHFG